MKHRTFNKGETVHTLLTGTNLPNTFVPAKCIIKDIQWDEHDPKYLVKIIDLYDNIYFLKKTLLVLNFWKNLIVKPAPLTIDENKITTVKQLLDVLNSKEEERFYIYTHSLLTLKNRLELNELFNKLQYFLIARKFKELKELSTRTFYKGVLRIDTQAQFDIKLKEFLEDLFDKHNENLVDFIKTI